MSSHRSFSQAQNGQFWSYFGIAIEHVLSIAGVVTFLMSFALLDVAPTLWRMPLLFVAWFAIPPTFTLIDDSKNGMMSKIGRVLGSADATKGQILSAAGIAFFLGGFWAAVAVGWYRFSPVFVVAQWGSAIIYIRGGYDAAQ